MRSIYLVFVLMIASAGIVSAQQGGSGKDVAGSNGLWVGVQAGPSVLVEKAPDSLVQEIQDYYNKLRTGWHYGIETEYFINKYVGVGLKYFKFNTKQAVDSLVVEFFSKIYYFDLSSNMSIHALAPMVYGKYPLLKDKLTITGSAGPALLFYRNIGKAVGDTAMIKGSSPGITTSLRISYEIFPNLSIALQSGYTHAFLKKIITDDGSSEQEYELEKKDYQNISRLDYGLGVFYTFRRK